MYREDWIGVRKLDEEGRVERKWCEGEHMQIDGCWDEVLEEYFGEWMDEKVRVVGGSEGSGGEGLVIQN